jgi:hypothetical protein
MLLASWVPVRATMVVRCGGRGRLYGASTGTGTPLRTQFTLSIR